MPLSVSYRSLLPLVLLCLPLAAQISNQADTGTIAGTVMDSRGKPLPAVQITLSNDETGEQCKMATDRTGRYKASNLTAGSYQLRFAAKGFRTETKEAVYMCPSQTTQVDAKLPVGAVSDWDAEGSPAIVSNASPNASSPTQWIDGTVADVTGAVVPSAHVLATGPDGNRYETTSQTDGHYRLSNLPPGSYCLTFKASGLMAQTVAAQTGQSRDVSLGPMKLDMVCSPACPVLVADPPPAHPEIALEVRSQSNVVGIGSPLLLTAVLRNITDHPISIRLSDGPGPTSGYNVYAFADLCGCPGRLQKDDFSGKQPAPNDRSTVTLPAGETLTDKLEVGTLKNLNRPGKYLIVVARQDTSTTENSEHTANPPLIWSNAITVHVVPVALANACK